MTLYVDDLRTWNGKSWCHLCGTNASELDFFAVVKLGLKDTDVQIVGGYRHYSLTPVLRDKATRLGAKYITTESLLKRVRPGSPVT